MSTEKFKRFFSKENIEKTKESLNIDQLSQRLWEDRYTSFCTWLVGVSILLWFLTAVGSSTSHPQKVLSKYISAGGAADLVTLNELAPMNDYDRVATELGLLYLQDVKVVVRRAQVIGGEVIRAGHVRFVNRRKQFNQALKEDETFRRLPWAEKTAYVEKAWREAGGTGTQFVSGATFNQYGVTGFTTLWKDVVDARSGRYLNWVERNQRDRDLLGKELMSEEDAFNYINGIVDSSVSSGIRYEMAVNGWADAAAQSQDIVGSLSYEDVLSPQFMADQARRLLPLSLKTFYDDDFGVEDKESEIEPAGEGLFQPGQGVASARVKGGTVAIATVLDDGKWRISRLMDINNVGALYNTMKRSNSFAPGSSATAKQEG